MSSTATHRKQHGQTIMVGVRITLALNHYNLVLLCCQVLDSYFEIVGRSNCVGESVGHLLAWCAGLVQHGTAWNSMGILTCFTLVAQLLPFIKKSGFFPSAAMQRQCSLRAQLSTPKRGACRSFLALGDTTCRLGFKLKVGHAQWDHPGRLVLWLAKRR